MLLLLHAIIPCFAAWMPPFNMSLTLGALAQEGYCSWACPSVRAMEIKIFL